LEKMAIDREDFMAWVADALSSHADVGGDPRYSVTVTADGEGLECSVEYWREDNNGNEPDDVEEIRVTIQ
jgi:hypothetical protein